VSPRKPDVPGRTERKARRRGEIVAKSAELFIGRGYEGTSVNDVAEALGISVGGLYRYIDAKADLLTLVCDDIYGQLPDTLRQMAGFAEPPAPRLLSVCSAYLRACAENSSLIRLMYREYRHLPDEAQERYGDREEEIVAILRDLIAACLTSRPASAGPLNADVAARDIVFLGHLPALKGWALRRQGLAPDALLREQLRAISAMVLAQHVAHDGNGAGDALAGGALRWSGAALARDEGGT